MKKTGSTPTSSVTPAPAPPKAARRALPTLPSRKPRILIVTPEITYLPAGMGNAANRMSAKAGGLADVSASLVSALFELGADVHVALPHYQRMFHVDVGNFTADELRRYHEHLPDERIHLAEDRMFHYRRTVYSSYDDENPRIALAFQREVINHAIGVVKPDLIHCNDWMTGLIPSYARRIGIPTLFTIHNIHTHKLTLEQVENFGIDAAEFWNNLYYARGPWNYEETRSSNPVDLLCSGIFAAHYINTVSPTFLREIVSGAHDFVPGSIRNEIRAKFEAGCAEGILNAPDENMNPATDDVLPVRYTPETVREGKLAAKRKLQQELGLERDDRAPVFFWPSRLDPMQKGCQLLSDILYRAVHEFWGDDIQFAIIANGAYQNVFRQIAAFHGIQHRVAVCDFDERLSRLGYAGSDFMLMPSRFEPCGLPQMTAPIYGTLAVARNTGGLHDTVIPIDAASQTGNGILFNDYDAAGLLWGIQEAMRFYRQPEDLRYANLSRVMMESAARFNHNVCARAYIDMYERMLSRPLVPKKD